MSRNCLNCAGRISWLLYGGHRAHAATRNAWQLTCCSIATCNIAAPRAAPRLFGGRAHILKYHLQYLHQALHAPRSARVRVGMRTAMLCSTLMLGSDARCRCAWACSMVCIGLCVVCLSVRERPVDGVQVCVDGTIYVYMYMCVCVCVCVCVQVCVDGTPYTYVETCRCMIYSS